jgi:hypothetical protein
VKWTEFEYFMSGDMDEQLMACWPTRFRLPAFLAFGGFGRAEE